MLVLSMRERANAVLKNGVSSLSNMENLMFYRYFISQVKVTHL